MKERFANNQEDLLIRNGRIYTMDDADTLAQAVLIHGGCVAAVGSQRDVEQMARAGTPTLDLDGAFAVPGLLDTHPHLLHYGALEQPLIKIWDRRNHDEIVARIRERAGQQRPSSGCRRVPSASRTFLSSLVSRSERGDASQPLGPRPRQHTSSDRHPGLGTRAPHWIAKHSYPSLHALSSR